MKRESCASDKLKIERELLSQGFETVAGVDEVGRGLWRVLSYARPSSCRSKKSKSFKEWTIVKSSLRKKGDFGKTHSGTSFGVYRVRSKRKDCR